MYSGDLLDCFMGGGVAGSISCKVYYHSNKYILFVGWLVDFA